MVDYKKLYHTMFNAATDALRSMDACNYGQARERLIQAQQETEEKYIQSAGESKKQ